MLDIEGLDNRKGQAGMNIIRERVKTGSIVDLRSESGQVKVYSKHLYLGTIPLGQSDQVASRYSKAVVTAAIQKAVTFDYRLTCMTEDELTQYLRDKEVEAERARREREQRLLELRAQEQEEKRKADEARIPQSMSFRLTAQAYEAKRSRGPVSGFITGLLHNLLGAGQQVSIDEELQRYIQTRMRADPGSDEWKTLDAMHKGRRLIPVIEAYLAREATRRREEFERARIRNEQARRAKERGDYYVRETHCWHCGAHLSSLTHSKCTCKWLKCSCGACNKDCARSMHR